MNITGANFKLSFPEKNSKLIITVIPESFKNQIVKCNVTDMNGYFATIFSYIIEPLNSLTDVTTFIEILANGEYPQFWLDIAENYQLNIDDLAKDVERKYYFFKQEAETNNEDPKSSVYFDSNKAQFFASSETSKKMAHLSRRILEVLS